jgi:putative ABC transport system permease protein
MQDLRFALRLLWRSPGFTASAVLTLAIGIGVNTGIYSIFNGLVRPLPVPGAHQLVYIASDLPSDDTGLQFKLSYAALADYREGTTEVFTDVFGFDTWISGMSARGRTWQFVYHGVTGNTFSALGLQPAAGRLFRPAEGEAPRTERTVVLGYSQWIRRFGGDPSIVGSMVKLDGEPTRVIGVAPEGFHGLMQHGEIDGYVPLGVMRSENIETGRYFTDRNVRMLATLARLRPGVRVDDAQAAVGVVARRLQLQYPAEEKDVSARVVLETQARPVPSRFLTDLLPKIVAALLGLAALVLLIACMNVANLLLVRATAREREMAVRSALGSGRGRLIRLLVVESLLLSTMGLSLGLLLARVASSILLGAINPRVDVSLNLQFGFDWTVFGYAAAVATACGLVLGLVPAMRASRVPFTSVLHDGGYGGSSGGRRQRARGALVVAQVAGSLVLLIVAGLCVRNLQRMQVMDLGFEPDRLVTVRVDPRQVGYSVERAGQFYEELERRLRALPAVESVGMSLSIPMGYIYLGCQVQAEGSEAIVLTGPRDSFLCNPVSSSYFDTLGIPLVEGRAFNAHDTATSRPVVIVNETLARRLWPGESAVGKRVVMPGSKMPQRSVVGVARDSKYMAAFESHTPFLYVAMEQEPPTLRAVYSRVSGSPRALLPLVQREVAAVDPEVPIADLVTMSQALDGSLGVLLFRVGAMQATAMGALGLILAAIGIYGVVWYSAVQRTREIGIRLALGAAPRAIARLVIGGGASLVGAGVIVGLGAAALVTRALSRFFVLVGATDASTFVIVTALLAAIALFACYLPARRAMKVNPIVALRHE